MAWNVWTTRIYMGAYVMHRSVMYGSDDMGGEIGVMYGWDDMGGEIGQLLPREEVITYNSSVAIVIMVIWTS